MTLLFELPSWLTGFNFLIGLFSFLILAAGAFVILMLRSRTGVSEIQLDRAVAAEALVKIRDATLIDRDARVNELEDELEGVTAEHRTLVGIKIGELMEFWAQKEELEARMRDLERDLRVERKRRDGES